MILSLYRPWHLLETDATVLGQIFNKRESAFNLMVMDRLLNYNAVGLKLNHRAELKVIKLRLSLLTGFPIFIIS